jgi:site-specific recombinase XerD
MEEPSSASGFIESKSPQHFLSDVIKAVKNDVGVSHSRRRDLISAVTRVAKLLRDEPHRIALDLPILRKQIETIQPAKERITDKTWANIRSQFFAAIKIAKLCEFADFRKTPLSLQWSSLLSAHTNKRREIGLSRFARFASAHQISPQQIDDNALTAFIKALADRSLAANPSNLHRMTAKLWNELAQANAQLGLRSLTVPSFIRPLKRVDWSSLPRSFREDVAAYLNWCTVEDPFHSNARSRPLKPRTVKYLRDQLHAAVTALIESDFPVASILNLSSLVEAENFKRLLRHRISQAGQNQNTFNRDLAKALVRMAREWTKPGDVEIKELQRIASKVRGPLPGLTEKNKKQLRQFDDPETPRKLDALPNLLWRDILRAKTINFRILANAQTAIALELLICMAIRMHNLSALEFGKHIHLSEHPKGVSSLEISEDETKNGRPLAFDLPDKLVDMLRHYRDHIVPSVTGGKRQQIFVNVHGGRKTQSAIAAHIARTVLRKIGVAMSPHLFRHLAAKRLLDASPGDFETIRQLLGHRNMSTTTNFYAGIDSRRAARHHQHLIDLARMKNSTNS